MEPNVRHKIGNIFHSFLNLHRDTFLKYLEYFRDTDQENTFANGWITENKSDITINLCPYISNYNYNNTSSCGLKCMYDKGLFKVSSPINKINEHQYVDMEVILNFIENNFVFNYAVNDFILFEYEIENHLLKCAKRDIMLPPKIYFDKMPFKTIAQGEWNEFFTNYADVIVNFDNNFDEKAITLTTFLQFYFIPDILHERLLENEFLMFVSG